jgi:hypothetical protein
MSPKEKKNFSDDKLDFSNFGRVFRAKKRSKAGTGKRFLIILVLVASIFIASSKPTYAFDAFTPIIAAWDGLKYVSDKVYNLGKDLVGTAGSIALKKAVLTTVNTMAYDTATWVGSGGAGQKPQYFTGSPIDEWSAMGDLAAGNFIESFGKQVGVDFCEPTLSAKVSIGLGLQLQSETKPSKPDCTASQMVKNWTKALSVSNSKDFLKKFSGYFDIKQNDLGIALTAQTSLLTAEQNAKLNKQLEITMSGRYKENTDIAGDILGLPNEASIEENIASGYYYSGNLDEFTGDALKDAAGVFVNQLAATGFNTLKKKFTSYLKSSSKSSSSLYSSDSTSHSGGVATAQGIFRQIIEPTSYGVNTDYDVLAALSSCSNSSVLGGVGTDDCVIDEGFRQAIENKKTVGEAVSQSSLDGTKPFGSFAGDSDIYAYKKGYTSRSMAILRKYRIIPVGWELAAEFIKNNISSSTVAAHNNLNSLIACYDPIDSYSGYSADWCEGLVDPNWVLKVPQTECAKEGYGPQILSLQSLDQGTDNDQNKLQPKLSVTRSDSYCGDLQSCIKENDDGSCKYFGYCTEEKRLWKFGTNSSCDEEYNTCQAFKDESGNQVSYLENSLQYCSSDQAGCEEYAIPAAAGYDSDNSSINWKKSSDSVFLNGNAQSCDSSNEGCHEFLRFSSGGGTNLLINSDFSNDTTGKAPAHWSTNSDAVVAADPSGSGASILEITADSTGLDLYSNDWSLATTLAKTKSLLAFPENFMIEAGKTYTFSAEIYISSGDKVTIGIGRDGGYWQEASVTTSGSWQKLSVTLVNTEDILANEIKIFGSSGTTYYVYEPKFEVGSSATSYTAYRGNNLIYEKLMPEYLRDVCYMDSDNGDYRLKDGAPSVCSNFARLCNEDEVGCDYYTNNDDTTQAGIPAATVDTDSCPEVCDGYNTYIQKENNFASPHAKYFIPSTANTCVLSEVGCSEFTNLATSTSGGEQKVYYSYLRQCVKPEQSACGDFYTWEGSAAQGQQLVKYSLKEKTKNGVAVSEPDTTSDDSSSCNAITYVTDPTNPLYDSDCRQFYDSKGDISYHLYSNTITCTEQCSTFRLTYKNVLDGISESECTVSGVSSLVGSINSDSLHWTGTQCVYCKNGGAWSDAQQRCIYQAYTPESSVCSASAAGCGEYDGNGGANSEVIMDSEFESSNTGWTGGNISQASYVAGQHSYLFGSQVNSSITLSIKKNASYVLTFIARSENSEANLSASMGDKSGLLSFDGTVKVQPGVWRKYSLNMSSYTQSVAGDEFVRINIDSGSDTVYIDSIKLVETNDLHYLLADSWNTPAVCDEDSSGNPFPQYALGCASYNNSKNETQFLHSFDRLCQKSAVGCEAIIDTQNTISADADTSYGATTTINADQVIYAQYDTDKLCDSSYQGCQRLGLKSDYGSESTYSQVYLDNNPQLYSSILCQAAGAGCQAFTYTSGSDQQSSTAYFKDPSDQVCEWRQSSTSGSDNGWGWYKKKVKRCSGTGNLCIGDTDCSNSSCITETADNPCPTEKLKTIGTGGLGNEIYQPGSDGVYNWAGICPSTESSCTEYIDPVSDFSANIISNADFSKNIGSSNWADDWTQKSPSTQKINLEGGTLYLLTVENNNTATLDSPSGAKIFHILQADNAFANAVSLITVDANQSVVFYSDNTIYKITAENAHSKNGASGNNSKIILKKAVVNYELADTVDKSSCTGGANPASNCLYFNERSVNGSSYTSLSQTLDPWASYGVSSINYGDVYLANGSAIKVTPDRDCDSWLSCKSSVYDENSKKNVCLDIASCNRLDDNGDCANFTVFSTTANLTYGSSTSDTVENADTIKNLTGYARVGYPSSGALTDLRIAPNDLLSFGQMSQLGTTVYVPNGDFEFYTATSSPINSSAGWVGNPSNWTSLGNIKWTKNNADSLFSVISDPITAQYYGFSTDKTKSADTYPMIGKSFLRYSATTDTASPESGVISVYSGNTYYLSYYLNTFALTGGSAVVKVVDGSDNTVISSLTQGYNDGWMLKTQKFTAISSSIRIILTAASNSGGSVYVDDVKIAPVLLARQASDDDGVSIADFYDRQTCRLYPKEDSLSCSYYDDTGLFQQGDLGYCLQYDQAPGDPNACLLWWPIDSVKGTGLSSGQSSGYNNRSPLYYCTNLYGKDNSTRPYIDADHFFAKGAASITINNVKYNFNSNGRLLDDQNGGIITGKRFLNYGQNTITIRWNGNDEMDMNGSYYYHIGLNGEWATTSLNIAYLECVQLYEQNSLTSKISGYDITYSQLNDDSCDKYFYNVKENNDTEGSGINIKNCLKGVQPFDSGNYIAERSGQCSGNDDDVVIRYSFSITPICGQLTEVVDANGQNMALVSRISATSDYDITCNTGMPESFIPQTWITAQTSESSVDVSVPQLLSQVTVDPSPNGVCSYETATLPFGGANPPAGDIGLLSDPSQWSKPLSYFWPTNEEAEANGLMGQLYSTSNLNKLFAKSYGVWNWDIDSSSYKQSSDSSELSSPTNLCDNNTRNTYCTGSSATSNCDCSIAPTVSNITLNSSSGNIYLVGRGFVNVAFNFQIDTEHAPTAEYDIDWGDGETLDVSGSNMSTHPVGTDPVSAHHNYDYYNLLSIYNKGVAANDGYKKYPTLVCYNADSDGAYCTVKPRIKVVDNWGWCTEGGNIKNSGTTVLTSICSSASAQNNISGYCVDATIDGTRHTNGNRCWSNNTTIPNYSTNQTCSGTYKYCDDGWWEASGMIVVRKQ